MDKKPMQDVSEVLMRDLQNPKYASYDGFMKNADGQSVPCRLLPGLHRLPTEKVDQLCTQFPFLFTVDADEIEAFQNPKPDAPPSDPTAPTSTESSTEADGDTSTDSSARADSESEG